MSIVVKKLTERWGKYQFQKRWLEDEGEIREIHVTLLGEIDNMKQALVRYDKDEEGSHIHLKIMNVPDLDLEEAQKIIKRIIGKETKIRELVQGE
jgi:divalent metal cation (Fe/Co/Zn/Cd) transporter